MSPRILVDLKAVTGETRRSVSPHTDDGTAPELRSHGRRKDGGLDGRRS